MKLGETINILRRKEGLTQTELADKLGVTEQTVSKWENDKCYPDISLLPLLANIFHCSVDAVLGIEGETYIDGVQKVINAYNKCTSLEQEIELLREALTRFPNNNELKHKLAHSYFMAWRITDEAQERQMHYNRVIGYCESIISAFKDDSELDKAYDLLIQIYAENGEYEKALHSCNCLSSKSWKNRLVGIAQIYKESNNCEFSKYAQNTLFELQTAMRLISQLYCNSLIQNKKYDEALIFCETQGKILSLFDRPDCDLYLCEKMMLAFQFADIYKKKSQINNVYDSLSKMCDFAKLQIAKGVEHSFSENPNLHYVKVKEPYMYESEIKDFVNTFLDKFADVLDTEQLEKVKI